MPIYVSFSCTRLYLKLKVAVNCACLHNGQISVAAYGLTQRCWDMKP